MTEKCNLMKGQIEQQEIPEEKIAWLGPSGTFTELATKVVLASPNYLDAILIEAKSIDEIFLMVENGQVDYGVVPIDNSSAGPVKDTHAGLRKNKGLKILGEYVLPIRHSLYRRKDALDTPLEAVVSKDQALEQCSQNLKEKFGDINLQPVNSTSLAVKMASENKALAAIGSSNAADALGIENLMDRTDNMQDNDSNATMFVVIGKNKEIQPLTGNDKTTFIIDIPHKPGSLYNVLEEMNRKGINLTKIKSLPGENGNISFLISIDGHEQDENVSSMFSVLELNGNAIQRLGSYQKADYVKPETKNPFNMDYAIKNIKKEAQNGTGTKKNESVVVFTLPNEQGALAKALKPFAEANVNLSLIETQPSGRFEEYIFYLAFQNNIPNKKQLIDALAENCNDVVLLNAEL